MRRQGTKNRKKGPDDSERWFGECLKRKRRKVGNGRWVTFEKYGKKQSSLQKC